MRRIQMLSPPYARVDVFKEIGAVAENRFSAYDRASKYQHEQATKFCKALFKEKIT